MKFLHHQQKNYISKEHNITRSSVQHIVKDLEALSCRIQIFHKLRSKTIALDWSIVVGNTYEDSDYIESFW